MTPATSEDRDWIEVRLRSRVYGAMFPLANLAAHGWESDAPRAMRFWVDRDQGLLLGATNEGMLLPAFVSANPDQAAEALSGKTVIGVLGVAKEARALLAATMLHSAPTKLDSDEPQFLLDLDNLNTPRTGGHLVPVGDMPRELLVQWRKDYVIETLGEPEAQAMATAEHDVGRHVTAESHRVLIHNGEPVAMSGVNAALSEIVQMGGVYTPPEYRCRGYARRAVALHLEECRAQGVRQATLFASGDAAVKAYEALGFRSVGSFSLVLFRRPQALPI